MTIEALEDGLTVSMTSTLEYSTDGVTWNTLTAKTTTPAFNAGDKIAFRANLTPSSSSGIGTFTISKKCNLRGNCMSLLFGDEAENNTDLTGKGYAFYRLFYNCKNIVNVDANFLPATTLADSCYYNMFYGCTSLTTAPELPATTLADSCYYNMFYGCTSLVTAPELPATTLNIYCYSYMFYGCTSLVTAPELPATNLANACYYNMFNGCTSLVTAPELPATTLSGNCYNSMFLGCSSLTTAPELPATTLSGNCYNSMFYGCSSLTTAPELPAEYLKDGCYRSMFYRCSNLNYVKMLATADASFALNDWMTGVKSTGAFVKHPNNNWISTGTSGIPEGWTVETATS